MLSITEISQLFDNIAKAANKKAEPIICNGVLMNAGRQIDVHRACPAIPAQGRAGVRPVFIEP